MLPRFSRRLDPMLVGYIRWAARAGVLSPPASRTASAGLPLVATRDSPRCSGVEGTAKQTRQKRCSRIGRWLTLDGVDQHDYLEGKSPKSGRDFLFYFSGATPSAVRYKNQKIYYTCRSLGRPWDGPRPLPFDSRSARRAPVGVGWRRLQFRTGRFSTSFSPGLTRWVAD
jgi:hypothetical protein